VRYLAIILMCCAYSTNAFSQEVPPPSEKQVDMNEVYRRGDTVVVVGEGPRSGPKENFIEAMEAPADDSHKWFITVWSRKDCQPCAKLKYDFEHAPELLAFVAATEEQKAWSHFNIYYGDDATQEWRRKLYKVERYPTIVIQPPLDCSWGEPSNVVFYQVGYDGIPQNLANAMAKNIRMYVAVMTEKGYPHQPKQVPIKGVEAAEEEQQQQDSTQLQSSPMPPVQEQKTQDKSTLLFGPSTEGTGSKLKVTTAQYLTPLIGQTAPFTVPTRPDNFQPSLQPQQPQVWPVDPNQPQQQPQNQVNPDFQWVKNLLSSAGLTNTLVIGYLIFTIYTKWKLQNNPSLHL